jgi:hypothetical protein
MRRDERVRHRVTLKPIVAKAMALLVGIALVSTAEPARASAAPGDDPCTPAVSFICRFVPVAPELDGDVDLTKQLPSVDPTAPPADSLPPLDPCANGCV